MRGIMGTDELHMGKINAILPVKLFCGILTSLPEILPEARKRLEEAFGPVDLSSAAFPFDQTHYYDEEMGTPILRYFLSFTVLIAPSEISVIKKSTNAMEAVLAGVSPPPRRPINLDPGYLEESKIVLASTKNFYHRILLADGIYGEVTLHYSGGAWQSFPWSFPDFRSGRYDRFFTELRRRYRSQLQAGAHSRDQTTA
jgi:hypothetical protein